MIVIWDWEQDLRSHINIYFTTKLKKMKKMKTVLLAIMVLLAGASFGQQKSSTTHVHKHGVKQKYTCSMHPEVVRNKPGRCPKCNMKLTKLKATSASMVYMCPMKCEGEKTYSKSGKCPECGMSLEPVDKKTKPTHNHSDTMKM